MARQGIFTGSSPNDGTGDSLLVGASKINQNFSDIYSAFGDGNNLVSYANTAGVSTSSQGLTGTPNITVNRIVAGLTSSIIPFYWDNFADLPSFSTYHGAFAHVHETGKAYYAHGRWVELVNKQADGKVGTGTENFNVGVITATTFYGDGSQLTGITASGGSGIALTALSVTVNSVGVATLSYNNTTGVFAYTPPNLTGYATTSSIVGFITAGALTAVASQFVTTSAGIHTLSNVGIGTTNPTSALTVTGDVKITGISTFGSINLCGNLTFTSSGNRIVFPAASYSSQSAYINLYTSSNTSATINGSNTGRLNIFNTTVNSQATSIDIRTDQHLLSDSDGNYYELLSGGSVSLYHIAGGTASKKFETLGTGITVTGSVSATSFIGSGSDLTGIVTSGALTGFATEGALTALTINDLADVNAGGPSTGQVLKWSGTEWNAAADLTAAGGSGIGLTDLSITVNSVGVSTLSYNNATGVFAYTPPNLTGYATTSSIVGFITSGALTGFTTAGALVGFITAGALTGYATTSSIVGFITSGALTGFITGVNITAG